MFSRKQRKRIRRATWSGVIVILLIMTGYFVWEKIRGRKPKFTRYPEFGIVIPGSYSIHGIDVSKYQDMIAWEEVQAMKVQEIKLGFAFIKATEGIGKIDIHFNRNWKKSKSSGIIRGAYHFFIASK